MVWLGGARAKIHRKSLGAYPSPPRKMLKSEACQGSKNAIKFTGCDLIRFSQILSKTEKPSKHVSKKSNLVKIETPWERGCC
jgi:hypothetical protein